MASISDNESSEDEEITGKRMGFDCEFVEPPYKVFVQSDFECPVCLQIIRDPHQVNCCGQNFCESCIERVLFEELPCPTCKAEDYYNFPDLRLQRALYSQKVNCSNLSEGCVWTGELRKLDEHLNTDPLPGKQLEGCPLTAIKCEFRKLGCKAKLPRKDMSEHVKEGLATHFSLLAARHEKQESTITRQFDKIRSLVTENSVLKKEVSQLNEKFTSSQDKQKSKITQLDEQVKILMADKKILQIKVSEMSGKLSKQEKESEELKRRMDNKDLKQTSERTTHLTDTSNYPTVPLGPHTFDMTNFHQHKIQADWWYSPPVYTHHYGYKICLGVSAIGQNSGKGTHVSVCVCFMKGEFDNLLKWPFRGSISITLEDRTDATANKTVHYNYLNGVIPDQYCDRVIDREMGPGWGIPMFVAHSELEYKYLHKDCLKFKLFTIPYQSSFN